MIKIEMKLHKKKKKTTNKQTNKHRITDSFHGFKISFFKNERLIFENDSL